MKKSKKQMRNSKPRRTAARAAEPEPMNMEALRGQISKLVRAGTVGMVKKIIAQGKGGHYQAMKYLFEMIGLFPPTAATQEGQEKDSLTEMLLRRLGIPEEPGLAVEETDAHGSLPRGETP